MSDSVVLTPVEPASDAVRRRFSDDVPMVVCPWCRWCDSCRQFHGVYEAVVAADPRTLYVWLDIEDDEALIGDFDIEAFPRFAVYRGARLLHVGPSLPQAGNVARVIAAAAAETLDDATDAVRRLAQLVRSGTRLRASATGNNDGTSTIGCDPTAKPLCREARARPAYGMGHDDGRRNATDDGARAMALCA